MKTTKKGKRTGGGARPTQASEFDMSITSTPAEWFNAQEQSPIVHDDTPLNRHRGMKLVPKGRQVSVFNVGISALIGSLVSGSAWFFLYLTNTYTGPWFSVVAGIFIALVVRLLAGGGEATFQGAVASGVYVLTLAASLLLIARRQLREIYGSIADFGVYETHIIETRLQEPVQVLAILSGLFATIMVTYFLRER